MLPSSRNIKNRFSAKLMSCLMISVLLAISFAVGCGKAQPEEMDRLIWRASWLFGGSQAPMFTGLEKGFWADEGIDIQLKPGAWISNVQLIGNGVELFADEGYEDMINAVQKGVPIKAVFGHTQSSPIAIISRADNPIRTPKDLEGKSIAAGAGSGSLAILPAVMEAAGADFSKVTVRIVDWGAIQEMLMLGKVDAIPLYWTNTVPELEAKGLETHYITYSDFGVNILSQGLIVNDELIQENPDLIRRFIRAMQKSYDYAAEHQDEAIEILLKHVPDLDKEASKQTFQNILTLSHTPNTVGKPRGWMAKEDWEQSQDIMINYLDLEKRLPVEDYYTNEFIPQ